MRLSTYNILIKADNKNIVLNSLYGTIDEIEDEIYFALLKGTVDDISEDIQKELLSRGYLTTFTVEKETGIVKNIIKQYYALQKNENRKSYTIILSYNCNFRCPYCFEKQIGKIYPCWDVTDQPEHCIGTFFPEITENKQALHKWRNRENVIIEKCIECPYVLYCGGGCMIKAKLKKRNFDEVECDSFPEIFKSHFLQEYHFAYQQIKQK